MKEFVEEFWECVSEDEFKDNWHIALLCKELEQIAQRVAAGKKNDYDLLINIPPGTTKTTIVSVMFPVWCWTRWYWMKFITASYTASLALESADKSRDIVRSEKFQLFYPGLEVREDKDTKSNFKLVKKERHVLGHKPRIKQGGTRYSTSVGGTMLGFHGHILIVDDPINPKQEALSEAEIRTANYWMDQKLSTRKTDKAISSTIMIMQRLSQGDPSGNWLTKKKRIRHIRLPGEIRNYGEYLTPAHLKKYYRDDLLDPDRMPWEVLEDMEADLGQYGYAGQVGQNPTPPGGGMFKVDQLGVVDSLPGPSNWEQTVRYWDKAGSEGAGAWTVGVKMLRLKNNKIIITDVRRGQWSSEIRERVIKQTAEGDGVQCRVGVEQESGSGGKESAEATVRNLMGFSVIKDLPSGDKVNRADPLSVQVNAGNVMMLRGDWNHSFVEELRYFPYGTYKDQVDAASGAFKLITGKRTARMLTKSRRER